MEHINIYQLTGPSGQCLSFEASWRRFRCRRDARNSQRELFDKRLADIQKALGAGNSQVKQYISVYIEYIF